MAGSAAAEDADLTQVQTRAASSSPVAFREAVGAIGKSRGGGGGGGGPATGPEESAVLALQGDERRAQQFRRALLADTEAVAIDRVFISANTSVLSHDELKRRVGLVPLRSDVTLFEHITTTERNRDTRSGRNTALLTLDVEHPTEATGIRPVLAGELVCSAGGAPVAVSHPGIVLARLQRGQHIRLEAYASRGAAREHARWSHVASARVVTREGSDSGGDDDDDEESSKEEGDEAAITHMRVCTIGATPLDTLVQQACKASGVVVLERVEPSGGWV